MFDTFLDLLLPARCGACGRLGAWLCEACRDACRRLEEPLCPRCGVELPFVKAGCGCRARLHALRRLRAATAYEGPVERAIHRLKYEGWRPLGRPLAGLIADRVAVDGLAAAVLVAVPLHPRRERERGFNQAELLAGELRRRLRLSRAPGQLVRLRDTPPQVGLDRVRRADNMRGAFLWRGQDLKGAAVALIDDVATTGATLEACASALRVGGAGPVIGLAVARRAA
jgi:ComF family protein